MLHVRYAMILPSQINRFFVKVSLPKTIKHLRQFVRVRYIYQIVKVPLRQLANLFGYR